MAPCLINNELSTGVRAKPVGHLTASGFPLLTSNTSLRVFAVESPKPTEQTIKATVSQTWTEHNLTQSIFQTNRSVWIGSPSCVIIRTDKWNTHNNVDGQWATHANKPYITSNTNHTRLSNGHLRADRIISRLGKNAHVSYMAIALSSKRHLVHLIVRK